MKVMYALVIILIIISIVATLFIAGGATMCRSGGSTKRNFKNLTLIYVFIGILGLIVLVYIFGFFLKTNYMMF